MSHSTTYFTSILCTDAGGAVLELTLAGISLDLSTCSFSSCGSNTVGTLGGAVKLTISSPGEGCIFTTGTFTNCEAVEKHGLMFYASSLTLLTSAAPDGYNLLSQLATEYASYSADKETMLYASITSDPPYDSYLSHVLLARNWKTSLTKVFVEYSAQTSEAYLHCGWEDLPCRTITAAYSLVANPITTVEYSDAATYTASALQATVGKTVVFEGCGSTVTLSAPASLMTASFVVIKPTTYCLSHHSSIQELQHRHQACLGR